MRCRIAATHTRSLWGGGWQQ